MVFSEFGLISHFARLTKMAALRLSISMRTQNDHGCALFVPSLCGGIWCLSLPAGPHRAMSFARSLDGICSVSIQLKQCHQSPSSSVFATTSLTWALTHGCLAPTHFVGEAVNTLPWSSAGHSATSAPGEVGLRILTIQAPSSSTSCHGQMGHFSSVRTTLIQIARALTHAQLVDALATVPSSEGWEWFYV